MTSIERTAYPRFTKLTSAHTLRHTFATNLVRRGEDLVIVAELLGHSRVETVRVYTLPTEEQVQAAVDGAVIDY